MNFSNYDYRSPSIRPSGNTYSPQMLSTPSNPRFLIPRFGYSSIPSYPRPRSSASKPNPDSYPEDTDLSMDNMRVSYNDMEATDINRYGSSTYNDSMMNNFGSPDSLRNVSRDDPFSNYSNSFQSPNSSAYYSCNDTFEDSAKFSPQAGALDPPNCFKEFSPFKNKSATFGMNNGNASHFQNNSNKKFQHSSDGQAKAVFRKKINPIKPKMVHKNVLRCSLCSIDFTSRIPYDMHVRGARHAKKIKSQDVYESIQKQVALSTDIASIGNSFRCDLCNVYANSCLQFQTHLDGTKHKNKLLLAQQTKEKKVQKETKSEPSQVNGKSNGSTVRSLPSDFEELQSTKSAKYSCDICSLIVNSEIQLQQHSISRKHQAKAEGKPLPSKKKFQKKTEPEALEQSTEETVNDKREVLEMTAVESKTVVGVKALSSSFVQAETQH